MNDPVMITNEADREVIRGTRHSDGVIVVEWCPCDDTPDMGPSDFGWVELARREEDGETQYADGKGGDSWSEARSATVNDVLRMV